MPLPKNQPAPSIQRLPSYLRLLETVKSRGERVVSCTYIADELGQQSVQVRKDLAITGVTGRPKVGYRVDELIAAIKNCLGWDHKTNAFLVGVGNLGTAILNYEGFVVHGLNIVGVFDVNPQLRGKAINGRKILAVDEMVTTAAKLKRENNADIALGIITVPAHAAQQAADLLVAVGVRAIWNYAPAALELPGSVICENVKLSESFAVLTNRMKTQEIDEARNELA